MTDISEAVSSVRCADTSWDDMVASLIGKRLNSAAGKVAYNYPEATITMLPGGIITNDDDAIVWASQLPHRMKTDTNIKLHMHWEQPDVTAREITVEYRIQKNGQPKNTTWTQAVVAIIDTKVFTYASGVLNQISALADIVTIGAGISATIQFRMARTDVNAGNIEVSFVDFHYEVDSWGSDGEYIKDAQQ